MKKQTFSILLPMLFSIFVLLLSSCNGSVQNNDVEHGKTPTNNQISTSNNNSEAAYPIQRDQIFEGASSYPIDNLPNENQRGPIFDIDKPITVGSTIVTGTGPADVPLRLINLSQVDLIIGETTIDIQGRFFIELDEPLISGHSIGIQLGDISGTSLNTDDFIYSDTYYERPYVGILFDIAIVD